MPTSPESQLCEKTGNINAKRGTTSAKYQPFVLGHQDHYKFCYTAALQYLDSFDTYANFKEL